VVDTPARHRAALTDGVDDVGPGVGVDTAVWPLPASTATIRGSRSGQVVADSRATIRVTGGHHQRAPVVVATPDAAARRAMGRNVLDPVGHAGQHRDDMADDAAAGSRRPTRRCRPRHGGSTRSRCHGASSSRARDTSAGSRSSFCCHLVLVPMTAAGRARPTEEAGTATAAGLARAASTRADTADPVRGLWSDDGLGWPTRRRVRAGSRSADGRQHGPRDDLEHLVKGRVGATCNQAYRRRSRRGAPRGLGW
jgi:hypothetical protein